MPKNIDREGVRALVARGAQLVEVLPRREHEDEHLPGAISLPLKRLDGRSASLLQWDCPVIVYCYNQQWDMSPRAASRLESLGFREVYDYTAGKADWSANGLPTEGRLAHQERAGDFARRDVPTCGLPDRLAEVGERMRTANADMCMVLDQEGVVLGRVRKEAIDGDACTLVESAMEPGPSTFRPNVPLEEMAAYMQTHRMGSAVITTSDGRLVGVLYRRDVDRRAGSSLVAETP